MQPWRLHSLLKRCGKPIFATPEDLFRTTRALVELAGVIPHRDQRLVATPLKKYARKHPAMLLSILRDSPPRPDVAEDGKRLALFLSCLSAQQFAVPLWRSIHTLLLAALRAEVWKLEDVTTIVFRLSADGWEEEDMATAEAVRVFVGTHLASANEEALVSLVSMAARLPEPQRTAALNVGCAHAVTLVSSLVPNVCGHLCGVLNRVEYNHSALAAVLQEEAHRIAQGGDVFTAVQVLAFICRHDLDFISGEALQWLIERLMGEPLDVESVIVLCRAANAVQGKQRGTLEQEMHDLLVLLASQVKDLFALPVDEGGLCGEASIAAVQMIVSSFLRLGTRYTQAGHPSLPEGLLDAVDVCAAAVSVRAEEIVADGSAQLSLVPTLLNAPSNTAKGCGLTLLRECATQHVSFPALQTFRFLLLLGDHALYDRVVFRHLRDQFAKTAAEIPIVQLCTALRCLARGLGSATGAEAASEASKSVTVEEELDREDAAAFFRFCAETVRNALPAGVPVRCVLSLVENLYRLGCRDEAFFEELAVYLDVRKHNAGPHGISSETAEVVCLALGEDLLDAYPYVHSFLLEAQEKGTKGERHLTPSAWMILHDPANAIAPLTEQQMESRALIERMVHTRADDRDQLLALAREYMALLPGARPDDHKYFFGVFEEKVLKEDVILKECLDSLLESGIVAMLSGVTIGAILQSLAALRFSFVNSAKRLVLGVTEEQWASMEAAPLVQVLSGMAKLSLRCPSVLSHIGKRLTFLSRFLTPYDTAEAVYSLQALGYADEAVLGTLIQHAAKSARRFDEVSLSILFKAPSVHRLLRQPEIAAPLLEQAAVRISSPPQRHRIAMNLKRSALPRDFLAPVTARLIGPQHGAVTVKPLQLT